MVGLGRVAELTLGQDRPIDDALIYYNSGVHDHPDDEAWQALEPGYGVDRDHFGPELGLARALRAQWPDRPLGFIKVAEGGTGLHDRWRPGGDLFERLVQQVNTGLERLDGPTEVVGLVWMQGESDASNPQSANAYGGLWTQFIRQVRMELDLPALPITAGLIRPNALWPAADIVREQTAQIASANGNVQTVETADLSVHEPQDPAHFDTQSTLTLGRRFGQSLAEAVRLKGNQPSAPRAKAIGFICLVILWAIGLWNLMWTAADGRVRRFQLSVIPLFIRVSTMSASCSGGLPLFGPLQFQS